MGQVNIEVLVNRWIGIKLPLTGSSIVIGSILGWLTWVIGNTNNLVVSQRIQDCVSTIKANVCTILTTCRERCELLVTIGLVNDVQDGLFGFWRLILGIDNHNQLIRGGVGNRASLNTSVVCFGIVLWSNASNVIARYCWVSYIVKACFITIAIQDRPSQCSVLIGNFTILNIAQVTSYQIFIAIGDEGLGFLLLSWHSRTSIIVTDNILNIPGNVLDQVDILVLVGWIIRLTWITRLYRCILVN